MTTMTRRRRRAPWDATESPSFDAGECKGTLGLWAGLPSRGKGRTLGEIWGDADREDVLVVVVVLVDFVVDLDFVVAVVVVRHWSLQERFFLVDVGAAVREDSP